MWNLLPIGIDRNETAGDNLIILGDDSNDEIDDYFFLTRYKKANSREALSAASWGASSSMTLGTGQALVTLCICSPGRYLPSLLWIAVLGEMKEGGMKFPLCREVCGFAISLVILTGPLKVAVVESVFYS